MSSCAKATRSTVGPGLFGTALGSILLNALDPPETGVYHRESQLSMSAGLTFSSPGQEGLGQLLGAQGMEHCILHWLHRGLQLGPERSGSGHHAQSRLRTEYDAFHSLCWRMAYLLWIELRQLDANSQHKRSRRESRCLHWPSWRILRRPLLCLQSVHGRMRYAEPGARRLHSNCGRVPRVRRLQSVCLQADHAHHRWAGRDLRSVGDRSAHHDGRRRPKADELEV
jgi:hypothetical protein